MRQLRLQENFAQVHHHADQNRTAKGTDSDERTADKNQQRQEYKLNQAARRTDCQPQHARHALYHQVKRVCAQSAVHIQRTAEG